MGGNVLKQVFKILSVYVFDAVGIRPTQVSIAMFLAVDAT